MGASLLIKLGPYAVIGILAVLLGIDHYRLIACDSQRQAADAANHQFQADTKEANRAIAKAHSDLLAQESFQKALQAKIDKESVTQNVAIKKRLAHPPAGNCDQLMGDLAVKLGGLK